MVDTPKHESVWLLMVARDAEEERHGEMTARYCLILVESGKQHGAFERIERIGIFVCHRSIRGRWRVKTLTLI